MSRTRSKEPQTVRSQILEAAQDVLLEDGLNALTQERVLARLDISRGGLQQHFRSKRQLLDGLFARLFQEFAAEYKELLAQEPDGPARHLRAYIRTAFPLQGELRQRGRTLALLALSNKHHQAEWAEFVGLMSSSDSLDPGTQLACRLFADGLWFNYVYGQEPDSATVDAALEKIYRMIEAG